MADIRHLLDKIRKAIYGKEVRGSLADGLEAVNNEVEDATEVAVNVEQRQDAVEQQFNTLLGEWSDDKPIDNAETIAARTNTKESKTYENLGKRLDEEYGKVTRQLSQIDHLRRNESMINRKEPDGLYITWTDDDGWSEVYDRFKQILIDYKIPIASAIIPDRIINSESGRYLTPEQVKELSDLGMEFLSHTNAWDSSDPPINWSEERLDEDFSTSQRQVRELGGNPRGLVLPYGNKSPLILKVAKRYYDYVIGTGNADREEAGKVLYPGEIDNYYVSRVTVERGFDYVKKRLDEGAEKGIAWINLSSHIYYDWYSDEYCRQIIEYAQGLGYKFITNQEGIERFGNIAQFGNNRIGADGKTYGEEIGRVVVDHNVNINGNTPVHYFKENAVTHSRINAYRGGFPDDSSGFLETHRYNNDLWAYQKFTTTRTKRVFLRSWDVDNEVWTSWERHTLMTMPEYNNDFGFSTTFSEFKLGLTYSIITSLHEEIDQAPEGKPGTLVTHKLTLRGPRSYSYQEYHLQHSRVSYKRYPTGDDTWSDWVIVNPITLSDENNLSFSDGIERFSLGITYKIISSAHAEINLAPEGKPGTLVTHRIRMPQTPYSYQEYAANDGSYYRRSANSPTDWGPWYKFMMEQV